MDWIGITQYCSGPCSTAFTRAVLLSPAESRYNALQASNHPLPNQRHSRPRECKADAHQKLAEPYLLTNQHGTSFASAHIAIQVQTLPKPNLPCSSSGRFLSLASQNEKISSI